MPEKVADYIAAGARLVWVVDPVGRTVVVHTSNGVEWLLSGDDAVSGEPVLPGFRLPLTRLFADLPPR